MKQQYLFVLDEAISERAFQAQVQQLARLKGWVDFHQLDSRGTRSGWPDLVLAHEASGRVLFRELKSQKGRLSTAQKATLRLLAACGLDVAVWRPSDWAEIVHELGAGRAGG